MLNSPIASLVTNASRVAGLVQEITLSLKPSILPEDLADWTQDLESRLDRVQQHPEQGLGFIEEQVRQYPPLNSNARSWNGPCRPRPMRLMSAARAVRHPTPNRSGLGFEGNWRCRDIEPVRFGTAGSPNFSGTNPHRRRRRSGYFRGLPPDFQWVRLRRKVARSRFN